LVAKVHDFDVKTQVHAAQNIKKNESPEQAAEAKVN
jgi:hypothetical protein